MADQSEVERAREELENLAVAASPTMVWEQAFAVALDALLAAVRREERERVVRWLLKDLIDGGEISGVRDEAGYIDACLARALAAAKGGA